MKTDKRKEELLDVEDDLAKKLILHNDDFNTFDHVVESLVDICQHDFVQAEQCAWITHYKGKCDVKKGELDKLRGMRNQLTNRGLKATID